MSQQKQGQIESPGKKTQKTQGRAKEWNSPRETVTKRGGLAVKVVPMHYLQGLRCDSILSCSGVPVGRFGKREGGRGTREDGGPRQRLRLAG